MTDLTGVEIVAIIQVYLDSLSWEIKTADNEEARAFALQKYMSIFNLFEIIVKKYIEKNPHLTESFFINRHP